MSGIVTTCLSCLSAVDRWCHITACLGGGRSRDGIYETTLADNEREAVSDLLGYLENVGFHLTPLPSIRSALQPFFPSFVANVSLRSALKPISFLANPYML